MNINNLFRIAEAAKNVGDYGIANACFAVIASQAIIAQKFGSRVSDCDAARVAFLYESDDDDIIGALADPDGAGYYDLPALSYYGTTLMGGETESHYLCIPLPLVSRWFTNHMVKLMGRETPNGTVWVDRREHRRSFWRMSWERREAARRDLSRRLVEEAGELLYDACNLVLYQEPESKPESEPEDFGVTPEFMAKFAAVDEESNCVWTTYDYVANVDEGTAWIIYDGSVVYHMEYNSDVLMAVGAAEKAAKQMCPELEEVNVSLFERMEPFTPGEKGYYTGTIEILA